jgi:hypothetical protein
MVPNFVLYRIWRECIALAWDTLALAEIRKIGKARIVCLPPGTIRGERLRSLDWPTGIPEFADGD